MVGAEGIGQRKPMSYEQDLITLLKYIGKAVLSGSWSFKVKKRNPEDLWGMLRLREPKIIEIPYGTWDFNLSEMKWIFWLGYHFHQGLQTETQKPQTSKNVFGLRIGLQNKICRMAWPPA